MRRPPISRFRTPIRIVDSVESTNQAGETDTTEREVMTARAYVEEVKADKPRDGGTEENLSAPKVKATIRLKRRSVSLISTKFIAIISGFYYEIASILPSRYDDTVMLMLSRLGGGGVPARDGVFLVGDPNHSILVVGSGGELVTG